MSRFGSKGSYAVSHWISSLNIAGTARSQVWFIVVG
jgi:hypothetical protein